MGWSDVRHHYQDDEPPEIDFRMLRVRSGTVKRGRRCTVCKGKIPAGKGYLENVAMVDGRFEYAVSCRPEGPCPVREMPCPACAGRGSGWVDPRPESDQETGFVVQCERCGGVGYVPKPR